MTYVQSAVLDLGRKANYAGTWKILMGKRK